MAKDKRKFKVVPLYVSESELDSILTGLISLHFAWGRKKKFHELLPDLEKLMDKVTEKRDEYEGRWAA